MSDDTSGHDAFAAALSGNDAPQIEGTVEAVADQGQDGAVQDAGVQPESSAPQAPSQQDKNEAMVPSWRLREISEQREAERRERVQEQRELEELRQFRKEQEEERARQEQSKALEAEDFYGSDPAQYIDKRFQHNAQKALSPIERQIQAIESRVQQETQDRSRFWAEKEHGREAVASAWQRTMQALQSGDPDAVALNQRLQNSRDPFGDLIAFDKRRSTLDAIGGDLDGYNKRQQDELLKNPEFLARALEAHRSMATPVQTGVPGRGAPAQAPRTLPSLNRQTSSRDASGEGGVGDVFAQTIAERGRRPG